MARLILIADDSPIIQRKAQRILEDEGFEVQTVSNGVAAIKKLPALQPVLVLADVSMPGKDGYEVCEFVKTSAGLANVPVLLVGSDLEPYDEQRGARVRADGIIKKPFTPHDLIATVRRLTGTAEAPASPSTLVETTIAASVGASTGSQDIRATPAVHGAEEGGIQPAEVGVRLPEGDVGFSMGAPQPPDHSEDAPVGLLDPSPAPAEPFPDFAIGLISEPTTEPTPEVAPEPIFVGPEISREVEEARSRGAEEPGLQEIEGMVLPPQILDLTAPEVVPEPAPVVAEPTLEPPPELAPEPDVTGSESSREMEEVRGQEVEESRAIEELVLPPQLVDLTAPEIAAEPDSVTAEPTPEPTPETGPETSPEPVLASPETNREVEEGMNRELAESPTREVEEPISILQTPGSPVPESLESSTPRLPGSSTSPDPEWVYKVVHKVVTRMAPPVLAPAHVEELARLLAAEMMAELGVTSGPRELASESPSPGQ